MSKSETVAPKTKRTRDVAHSTAHGVKVVIVLSKELRDQLHRIAGAEKRSMAAQASLWVEERLQAVAA